MNLRRFFWQIYYSKSQRCTVFIILLLIAGFTLIPQFLKEKNAVKQDFQKETSHEAVDTLKLPATSLELNNEQFKLNGQPFTILGGSMHYFRVVPQYWEDRLTKLKAMGLNTVTTCIPWSIHEEFKGFIKFDQPNYDIVSFIEIAHKLGLYVILQPGPYVGAQLDFGGLPSWLLHETHGKLRSTDPHFLSYAEKYFKQLFALLTPHQYSNGGPIIAWQIDHENLNPSLSYDPSYVKAFQKIMIENGVKELMFTSDTWSSLKNNPISIPGILKGIIMEYLSSEEDILEELKNLQPGKPLFVTEHWVGGYDHWGENHHTDPIDFVTASVAKVLAMGASINFYMFHGGTNFGFISGADHGEKFEFHPMVTSFDCDALLNEAGDVTRKYKELRKVLHAHAPAHSFPKKLPEIPPDIPRNAYEPIKMDGHMPLTNMYKRVDQAVQINQIVPMEQLNINSNGGQSYGYVVYRTKLPRGAKKLFIEKYRDWAQVMIGSELVHTLDTMSLDNFNMDIGGMMNIELELKYKNPTKEDENLFLDIIVENLGRGSLLHQQNKGITGEVLIDTKAPKSWTVFPLSFHQNFITGVFQEESWDSTSDEKHQSMLPGFFKGTLTMTSKPRDTFLDMTGWGKGVVFVNDHVLGRYWSIGPQQTLYVPSIWFQPGENTVVILEFENRSPDGLLKFSKDPILDKLRKP